MKTNEILEAKRVEKKMNELRELCEYYKNYGIMYEADVDDFIDTVKFIEPHVKVTKEWTFSGDHRWVRVTTEIEAEVDFEATFVESAIWEDQWDFTDWEVTEWGDWH